MNPVLNRAALGTMVALAVVGAISYCHTVGEKNLSYQAPWMTDVIGSGPERFREVIAMVPPEAVVGYVSDLPDSTQRGQVAFYGARYALAPRLVILHETPQKQDWILGNFSKPVDLAQIEKENRLNLVQDLGSGVVIFRSW
jgi:hypothetical protein